MRILMLGWELPPHNSGGLGVACYELCRSLAAKGADIEFVLPYQAEHQVDFMRVTAAVPQGVMDVRRAGGAYDSYSYIYTDGREERVDIFTQQQRYEHAVEQLVRRRAAAQTFDIIHAHDWLTFRAAMRARRFTCSPIIVHVHSIERDRAGGQAGNPLVREIEGEAFLLADRIIAVSQHTKDMIADDYAIPPDKIQVVHNSIDPAALIPQDGANAYTYLTLMKQRGWQVVASVGRLTLQKGLANLLRAFRLVVEHAPKTLLLMVGAGEQYQELVMLAAELGIGPNVLFADFQRGKRYRDAFNIADLFVMPSISEPFGITALEAIAYGTPALITKQSGVGEVIRNTLRVDFWDINEMANQITAAVQHGALREELHAHAWREFKQLSWSRSTDRLLAIYRHRLQGAAV